MFLFDYFVSRTYIKFISLALPFTHFFFPRSNCYHLKNSTLPIIFGNPVVFKRLCLNCVELYYCNNTKRRARNLSQHCLRKRKFSLPICNNIWTSLTSNHCWHKWSFNRNFATTVSYYNLYLFPGLHIVE